MTQTPKRRNEYLKPTAFAKQHRDRGIRLKGSALERYVSWVLIDRESSSKSMTYMLMSATAYSRACGAASTNTSNANVRNLEHRIVELEEDKAWLEKQVDELRSLETIRDSLETRSATLDREQKAAQQLIQNLHQLEETVNLQNPKLGAKIKGNLELILALPPDANSREVISR
jgi:DNA repair exonuclease SbcCD ATPase subunit